MRLRYRLSLLILLVLAIGSLATLLLVRRSSEAMFRTLVFAGDARKAEAYAGILAEYRAERGSWEGVQSFLRELPDLLARMVDDRLHGEGSWGPAAARYPAGALRSLLADRIVVADGEGIIVADTAGLALGSAHPPRHLGHGLPIMADFERVGTVLVGSMVDSSLSGLDERFLASLTAALVWSTLGSAALALLVGVLFASRITRPLGALSRQARRLAAGGEAAPVPVGGADEVAELSAAFNEMTAELRRLDEAKRQVIADSAHELRTPVTLIRGTVEGMMDGVFPLDRATLGSVHEETLRLSRLIDTLRELELIESGELELELRAVDLGEAVRKALLLFAPQAGAKGIRLEPGPAAPEPALARGDWMRVEEVLYNLLSNAIAYTPAGGTVRVGARRAGEGWTELSVEDSGPGIPPAERERVFERFYRLDKSRAPGSGGRGLGLAIAREIAKAHGGSLEAGDSALGGARLVLRLPRAEGRAS